MPAARAQPSIGEDRRAIVATSQLCWLLTGMLLALVVAVTVATPLRFELGQLPMNALVFAVFGTVALFYMYLRFDPTVAVTADTVALLAAFTSIAACFSYAMAHLSGTAPFWDDRFLAADRALGFDWRAWLAWLAARPGLARALDQIYLSIVPQVGLLLLLLPLCGQHRRLQVFVLSAQLSLVAACVGAYLVPAIGIYEHLGIRPELDHPGVPLATMDRHVAQVMIMRGPDPVAALDRIEGIVVFPSFHMALAILFAWAFWGVRALRWPALALNVAMALATPLSGGHYLVDLMGGAVLAILALAAALRIRAAIERSAAASEAPLPMPARPAAAHP